MAMRRRKLSQRAIALPMNELPDSDIEFHALAIDESSDSDSESHASFTSALEEISQVSHFCVMFTLYHDKKNSLLFTVIYKMILDRLTYPV